jgi:TonB family protein
MKFHINYSAIFIGIIVLSCQFLIAQQSDTMVLNKKKEIVQHDENATATEIFKNRILEEYNIIEGQGIRAKILEKFEIRSTPSCDGEKTGIIIPENEIVFVYKYITENRCWVVNYGNAWGFIKDDIVFPISKSSIENKVSKFDVPPKPKSPISPKYPSVAKKKGIKGKVYLKVFIDEQGNASEVIILRGIEELNQAAIDAVQNVKYQPAEYQGNVVGVWVNLSITF